ncbi:MAG: TRAP transporter small permease [Rhodospirillales bacterium]|jgi:TRAP-type C4-dicarboxylate transport system permease small subunit|nr:TRAP transporter small permease [Rhodospirillales bacterium]
MPELPELPDEAAWPTDKVGRVLYQVSRILALFGGAVILAVAAMTTISVSGRFSLSLPIPGDIEFIELGTSTAVFAFLPYCQLMRGNVIVDFFLTRAPTRMKTSLDALGSLLYLIAGSILTWRLIFGGFDMYKYSEKTLTLGIPRWFSFPYATLCMAILIAVIIYTLGRSIAETRANRFFNA